MPPVHEKGPEKGFVLTCFQKSFVSSIVPSLLWKGLQDEFLSSEFGLKWLVTFCASRGFFSQGLM